MSSLSIIVCIIAIVFAVLEIILFFKIWGMTNDVKRICSYNTPNDKTAVDKSILYSLSTNKEKTKEYLDEVLLARVVDSVEIGGYTHHNKELAKEMAEEIIDYLSPFYQVAKLTVPERDAVADLFDHIISIRNIKN